MALLKGVATGAVVSLSIVVVASQMLNLQTLSTTPPEAATALDDSGTLPGSGPDTPVDEAVSPTIPGSFDAADATDETTADPASPEPPASSDTDLAADGPGDAPAMPDTSGDAAATLQMGAPDTAAENAAIDRGMAADIPPADTPDSRLSAAPEADPIPAAVPAAPGPTLIVDPDVTLAAPAIPDGPAIASAPDIAAKIDMSAPAAPEAADTIQLAEAPDPLGPRPAAPSGETPETGAEATIPGDAGGPAEGPAGEAPAEGPVDDAVDTAPETEIETTENAPSDAQRDPVVDAAEDPSAGGVADLAPEAMPGSGRDTAGETPASDENPAGAPDDAAADIMIAQDMTGELDPNAAASDTGTENNAPTGPSQDETPRGVSAADVIDMDQIVRSDEDTSGRNEPPAGAGIDGTDELEAGVPEPDMDDDIATSFPSAMADSEAAPPSAQPGGVRVNRLVQIEPAPEPEPAPDGQGGDADGPAGESDASGEADGDDSGLAGSGQGSDATDAADSDSAPEAQDDPSLSPDERVALAESEDPAAGPTAPSSNLIERRAQGFMPDSGVPGADPGAESPGAPVVTASPLEIDPDAPVAELTGDPMTDFRQPFDNPEDLPVMAVILLDYGGPMIDVPVNATIALDPTMPDVADRAAAYFAMGFEVAVMPDTTGGGSPAEISEALRASLSAVPFSLAVVEDPSRPIGTATETVEVILDGLSDSGHGLVTLPEGQNRAQQLAARADVPAGLVFRQIDNQGQDLAAVKRFLDNAAFRARQEETVILLGRNRPETTGAILEWRLGNRASDVELAPLSAALVPTGD
ncbi:divergent polysaccharide deacetylase family protein [Palleronia pelagia]|nr:divergent polysaccharide deacetylase family protein [Palleronia pelagia]